MGNLFQICRASLLFAALGLVPNVAQPAIYSWDANGASPANGDFGTANNWNPNTAPTSLDTAEFDLAKKSYTVMFPGAGGGTSATPRTYVTDRLVVGSNTVAFSETLAASTYEVHSTARTDGGVAMIVGELAGDSGILNNTLVKLSATAASIGDGVGSNGVLNANAGTFEVTGSGAADYSLIVGNHGAGALNVLNGSWVKLSASDGSMVLGKLSGSTGTATINGLGSLVTGSTVQINESGALSVFNGAQMQLTDSFNVDGLLNIASGGHVSNKTVKILHGTANINGNNSQWTSNDHNITVGGSVNVTNGGYVSSTTHLFSGFYQSQAAAIGVFFAGSVTIDGPGSTWKLFDGADLGRMEVGTYQHGTLSLTNGGMVDGFGVSVNARGVLSGDGIIRSPIVAPGSLNNGGLANFGVVAPGNPLGALHVEGDYFQYALSVGDGVLSGGARRLEVEIGGTVPGVNCDQLIVTGTVHLTSFPQRLAEGGALAISLVNDFTPREGDQFNILDFTDIVGTFETIDLPDLSGALVWDLTRLYTTGVISVILPGDFNGNGVVDSADYVVWRDNQGTANLLLNDPTGGSIGTAQYDQWRTHFGQTDGSGSGGSAIANSAVPEPSTLLMLVLAAAAVRSSRSRAA